MMNAITGHEMAENDHIAQSIRDVLTTRIGTRCMRREYGSIVPEMIDQPGNQATSLRLMAGSIMALARWEPRVIINKTSFSIDQTGKGIIDIEAIRRNGPRAGQPINMSVPVQ